MSAGARLAAEDGLIIPPTHPAWVARMGPPHGADHLAIPAAAYPRPPLDHRCWGQSVAYASTANLWSCPCGGLRSSSEDGAGYWFQRNTRKGDPDPGFAYPEAAIPWPRVTWWGRVRLALTGGWAR